VFCSCSVQAVKCALRALGGATLPRDGAAPFDPGREGRGLFWRWRRIPRCLYLDVYTSTVSQVLTMARSFSNGVFWVSLLQCSDCADGRGL
jgi:hypothetical protein